MKCLALIPARGGSKRIPRKNIAPFMGKPMISYAIELAERSGLFDKIMVSTDDPEIAEVAKKYGAVVPFMRTAIVANDNATLIDVIREVCDTFSRQGEQYDAVCCILPTAVLARVSDLKRCHSILVSDSCDSVFPVSKFSYPIQRALVMDSSGLVRMERPEFLASRSQDLEPAYHDAGQFYWINPERCIRANSIITDCSKCIVLPEHLVQDIDVEDDMIMAEAKIQIAMNRMGKQ